jgi:deoxyribodipyrimidine photo-lyase
MILPMNLPLRYRALNAQPSRPGAILYWMNREMRIHDNWALLEAYSRARESKQSFAVVFFLMPSFGTATNLANDRMYEWMKQGLKHVEEDAQKLGIPFYVFEGEPTKLLPAFIETYDIGQVIVDFTPLRFMRSIKQSLADMLPISVLEVDAHNIIPWFIASDKQEWGAYTIRPKIHRLLPTYLHPYPVLSDHEVEPLIIDYTKPSWLTSPSTLPRATDAMNDFLTHRLSRYEERNNPNLDATSRLSAYFHFGFLSTQTVALAVQETNIPAESFLEEMIVRKELADNYCAYNSHYDSFEGFPDWAKKTLDLHRHDAREFVYDKATLEQGKTHDEAWNAAQLQMVTTGYMHGYMRMYWAKKIFEWTPSPEEALAIANELNDTYELDGRDPNGYTGTAWAIGGVHDRPWQERPIFGMIRFMNFQGLKRKFDLGQYIRTWTGVQIVK